jgi:hypothetical protein
MQFPNRPNTKIETRRGARRAARFVEALPGELREALWLQPEEVAAAGELLRANGARRTVRIESASRSYVLKHYVEPTWRHAAKRALAASRAWAVWRLSQELADAGIRTPRPLACVENRWGPLRRDSFVLYGYIEGRTLRECLTASGNDRKRSEPLWRQLEELWQRLRELRISLADANTGNFIVDEAGQVWVIDLDKSRRHVRAATGAKHRERGWRQLLRSAAKCGGTRAA